MTRNEIIEQMVYHYQTAGTDGYGQLSTIMASNVIGINDPKQMELLQEIVEVSTYGGRFGTYKGFRPFGAFKDKQVEDRCKAAFRLNKSRIQNENNW